MFKDGIAQTIKVTEKIDEISLPKSFFCRIRSKPKNHTFWQVTIKVFWHLTFLCVKSSWSDYCYLRVFVACVWCIICIIGRFDIRKVTADLSWWNNLLKLNEDHVGHVTFSNYFKRFEKMHVKYSDFLVKKKKKICTKRVLTYYVVTSLSDLSTPTPSSPRASTSSFRRLT